MPPKNLAHLDASGPEPRGLASHRTLARFYHRRLPLGSQTLHSDKFLIISLPSSPTRNSVEVGQPLSTSITRHVFISDGTIVSSSHPSGFT